LARRSHHLGGEPVALGRRVAENTALRAERGHGSSLFTASLPNTAAVAMRERSNPILDVRRPLDTSQFAVLTTEPMGVA